MSLGEATWAFVLQRNQLTEELSCIPSRHTHLERCNAGSRSGKVFDMKPCRWFRWIYLDSWFLVTSSIPIHITNWYHFLQHLRILCFRFVSWSMGDDIQAPESMEIPQRCLPERPNLQSHATISVTNKCAFKTSSKASCGREKHLKVLLKPNPKSIIEEIGIWVLIGACCWSMPYISPSQHSTKRCEWAIVGLGKYVSMAS